MSNMKVRFLNEEYIFSGSLQRYVEYLQQFDGLYSSLLAKLTGLLQQKPSFEKVMGNGNSYQPYLDWMHSAAKTAIIMLSNEGIYNVTVSELVEDSASFKQLKEVLQNGIDQWKQVVSGLLDELRSGISSSYSNAASKITGSGVSVYSSSTATLMLHGLFEYGIMRQQAQEADREYSKALSSLSDNVGNKQIQAENDIMAKNVLPGIQLVLKSFSLELCSRFMMKLAECGKFNLSEFEVYNMGRSNGILENLDLVSNKMDLLKEAFKCCPYNAEVYKAVLRCGFCDADTFKIAKYFHLENLLLEDVKSYYRTNRLIVSKAVEGIEVYSLLSGEDSKEIMDTCYNADAKRIQMFYRQLKMALVSYDDFFKWMIFASQKKVEEIILMNQEEISNIAKNYINMHVSGKFISALAQLGYLGRDILPFDSLKITCLSELNQAYIEELSEAAVVFFEEARARKENYETHLRTVRWERLCFSQKIEGLRKEKGQMGIFESAKKEKCEGVIQRYEKALFLYDQKYNLSFEDYEKKMSEDNILEIKNTITEKESIAEERIHIMNICREEYQKKELRHQKEWQEVVEVLKNEINSEKIKSSSRLVTIIRTLFIIVVALTVICLLSMAMYSGATGKNLFSANTWQSIVGTLFSDAEANFNYGARAYDKGNYENALKYLEKAASSGHELAQYYLGYMYEKGKGVEQNNEKALSWYVQSANNGDADAQFACGAMYYYGEGTESNYEKSYQYFEMAALQGHESAQYNLGIMLEGGLGVEKNTERAIEWYRKAAKNGHEKAKAKLKALTP